MENITESGKILIRRLLGRAGLEIRAFTGSFAEHRKRILAEQGVATVWDVGANVGQYGSSLRDQGFGGRIVSVEPVSVAYGELERRSRDDNAWTAIHAAVGSDAGELTVNVSRNGQSSSLLPMLERHRSAAPASSYVATEEARVAPLDVLLEEVPSPPPFALKLDIQGYELEALRGATSLLEQTVMAEVELSIFPLYEGGANWQQVVDRLSEAGFALCDIERVYYDKQSGDLLQINGLFRRSDELGPNIALPE